jgi:type IX secretion system PorP/SprF family membrane protein
MKCYSFRFCIFSVVCLVASQQVAAQDPHFSQYFASPITLNPALIGKDVADARVSTVMRAQWWGSAAVKPYYTSTISFEKRLLTARPGNNSLAIAFSLLSDASNGGVLKNNYLTGGIAYNKALDAGGNELLGGGITVTYANRIFDAGKFEFQSQFGSMGFQRSMPSNDAVSVAGRHYWDVNAGIHYSKRNDRVGYHFGVSVFHAGTPPEAEYNGETYYLRLRTGLQAGLQFYLNNKSEIHLSSTFDMQGENRIYTTGALCKIFANDETIHSLNIGVWKRFGDAVYPYVGLEGNKWLAGIAYDIITGKENTFSQSVQSMEFSFVLKIGSVKSTGSPVNRTVFY